MFDSIRNATSFHHLPYVGCVLSVKINEKQTTVMSVSFATQKQTYKKLLAAVHTPN